MSNGDRLYANGGSRMSFTWIMVLLIAAGLLFALYAGNTRRKP